LKKTLVFITTFVLIAINASWAEECLHQAALSIYPYPQEACPGAPVELPASIQFRVDKNADLPQDIRDRYENWLRDNGTAAGNAGGAAITFSRSDDTHETTFRQEGYEISIEGNPLKINIAAASEFGFLYALFTLQDMVTRDGMIYTGTVRDFPRFSYRGVLEGGYSVWGHEQRLDVIKWLGKLKMNVFMYAPKEGYFFRRRWREPFSREALEEFREYVEACQRDRVDFIMALSPALSIEHANPEEMDRLVAKYKQIYDLGVRDFAIFFDDVLPVLSTPIDIETYDHIAEAEADVTNRLYERLKEFDPDIRLAFVPRQYWGWTPTRYIEIHREKLTPNVQIGWTGKDIVSRSITAEDSRKFAAVWGRPPAIGDNCSPFGPVTKRDPNLYTTSDSYLNNPYAFADDDEAQLSKFVDSTVADYAWNPEAYNPERSITAASVRMVEDPSQVQHFLLMLALNRVEVRSPMMAEITRSVRLFEKGAGRSGDILDRLADTGCTESFPRADFPPLMGEQIEHMYVKAENRMRTASEAALRLLENPGDREALENIKDALLIN